MLPAIQAAVLTAALSHAGNTATWPCFAESATPVGLARPGWKVLGQAAGDLFGTGRQDAAFVLARRNEDELDEPPPRALIIARRGRDGLLHPVALFPRAVPCRNCGGLRMPFQGVSIDHRELALHLAAGSGSGASWVDRFKLLGGHWLWVSTEVTRYEPNDPAYGVRRQDFLTHRVDERLDVYGKPGVVAGWQRYLEVWPALPTRLVSRAFVARLAATRQGDELCLTANVTRRAAHATEGVRLIDEAGQVVAPIAVHRTASPDGYHWVARYALADVGYTKALARTRDPDRLAGSPPVDVCLRDSVEVFDGQTVASTSAGGRAYPAVIRLRRTTTRPSLQAFSDDPHFWGWDYRDDLLGATLVPTGPKVERAATGR